MKFPRAQAMEAGCDGFRLQPISTRALPQILSDVVDRGKRDEP